MNVGWIAEIRRPDTDADWGLAPEARHQLTTAFCMAHRAAAARVDTPILS